MGPLLGVRGLIESTMTSLRFADGVPLGPATVAAPLGMQVEEAALAILRIVNNNMTGALRTVLLERGLDPREFALFAFGYVFGFVGLLLEWLLMAVARRFEYV